MKDILDKLTELEATAPKPKKMLTEDSATPPVNTSPATLKDFFESALNKIPIPGEKTGGGVGQPAFLATTDPQLQKTLGPMIDQLAKDKKLVMMTPGQPGQPAGTQTATPGQPAQAGATGQPQAGQQQMREGNDTVEEIIQTLKARGKAALPRITSEIIDFVKSNPKFALVEPYKGYYKIVPDADKDNHVFPDRGGRIIVSGGQALNERDEGKPGKNFAKIAKSAGKRYGSKEAGERVAGAVRAKLAKQGKLEEEMDEGLGDKIKKGAKSVKRWGQGWDIGRNTASVKYDTDTLSPDAVDWTLGRDSVEHSPLDLQQKLLKRKMRKGELEEGAKVDRMVKHIEKSERKLGKSKEKASDIAWATANKRGMLDNKNKKVKEADIPSTQGVDTEGANLGAGRSPTTLEGKTMKKLKPDFFDADGDGNKKEPMKKAIKDKKKLKEGASRIDLARRRGHLHGLENAEHCGSKYEDLDERKAYCEGYKTGLDECYGMGVYEAAPAMPPATVGGMADGAMDEGKFGKALATAAGIGTLAAGAGMAKGAYDYHKTDPRIGMSQYDLDKMGGRDFTKEDEFDEGNAFSKAVRDAKSDGIQPGETIRVGGKTYPVKEEDYAFESLDRQLNALLNEGEVNEGLSVSVSKGQQNSPDSVTITAQDADADQLLQLVKHAGLGLFGDDHAEPSSAMSVQPAHGEPDEVGSGGVDIDVVDGSDDMLSLMQKLTGIQGTDMDDGDEDYADEKGSSDEFHSHDDSDDEEGDEENTDESTCNECGMMETKCCCGDKEEVDEVETPDQQEFEVAEETDAQADEEAESQEDAALAGADSGNDEEVTESFFEMLQRLDSLAEGSGDKPKHPEHDKKDDKDYDDAEDDEEDDEEDLTEGLNEWANQVGKGPGKGTDASFEEDIEFMTKVIAGGLNKPKSTGQTTVPVIAGQHERMHDHVGKTSDTVDDWTKLAGIK
jgi:hypothetical protein